MLRRELVAGWQFDSHVDREIAEQIALERLDGPDLHVVVLSAGVGWVRALVISGAPGVGSLVYLRGRGLFEVARCDGHVDTRGEARVVAMLTTLPSAAEWATTR